MIRNGYLVFFYVDNIVIIYPRPKVAFAEETVVSLRTKYNLIVSRAGHIKRPRAYAGGARDVLPANHSDRVADQPGKGVRSDRNGRSTITTSTNTKGNR